MKVVCVHANLMAYWLVFATCEFLCGVNIRMCVSENNNSSELDTFFTVYT